MRKIIEHVRQQPDYTKRKILHVLTVSAGIMLLALWIYSLGSNFSGSEATENLKAELAPFAVLKDNMTLPEW